MFDIYIATPVLNAADTIDETIWSIVTQRGGLHIHYHVQDAGSTDGTLEKLHGWQKRLSNPGDVLARCDFTFVSEADNGLYDGVARAFARMDIPGNAFMGWLNADDLLWPEAFATIAAIADDLPEVDWLMGWPSIVNARGRMHNHNTGMVFPRAIIAAGLAESRCHGHFVQQESTFWKKSLWDKAGGLDTSFKLAGDWDLWRRFAKHAPLVHVQRNIGAFRRRPGQMSADLDRYFAEIDAKVPDEVRKYRLHAILQHKHALTVQTADVGEDGKWRLATL